MPKPDHELPPSQRGQGPNGLGAAVILFLITGGCFVACRLIFGVWPI